MSLWTLIGSMSSKVTVRGSLQDLDEKRSISLPKDRTNLVSEGEEKIQRIIRGPYQTNKHEKVNEGQCDTQTQSVLYTDERNDAQRAWKWETARERERMKKREKTVPIPAGKSSSRKQLVSSWSTSFHASQTRLNILESTWHQIFLLYVIDLIANNLSLHVSFLHLLMFNYTYTGLLQSFSLLKLAPASLRLSRPRTVLLCFCSSCVPWPSFSPVWLLVDSLHLSL